MSWTCMEILERKRLLRKDLRRNLLWPCLWSIDQLLMNNVASRTFSVRCPANIYNMYPVVFSESALLNHGAVY